MLSRASKSAVRRQLGVRHASGKEVIFGSEAR